MEDVYQIFKTIQGHDDNDSNCIDFSKLNKSSYRDEDCARVLDASFPNQNDDASKDLKGLKIGIVEEFQVEELDQRNENI